MTVVVVSWNTAELLRSCLKTVRGPAERGEIELVVVDNDSSDGSPEMVEREFSGVARLIRSGANIGFGAAANLGAGHARTEWIAIANADVEIPESTLAQLVTAGERAPHAGLIAPRLDRPSGERQESVFRFPNLGVTILAALGAHRLGSPIESWMFRGFLPARREYIAIEWAMGAFLLVRRSAFAEVGGFAADQWMYAEDLDLSWRMRKRGWQRLYVPAARVVHVGGAATEGAFGATNGTPEVVGAYYHWLRTRRGLAWMWAFAAVTLFGLAVRVAVYGLLSHHRRARKSCVRAFRWFHLTLVAGANASDRPCLTRIAPAADAADLPPI